MAIAEITLHAVRLPLITPYRLSYHVFESFEPFLARIRDDEGREGWGDQHISPGAAGESRESGWAFLREMSETLPGLAPETALERVRVTEARSPVAATILATAIEMLRGDEILGPGEAFSWPLLTSFEAEGEAAIAEEVERRLAEGFRTLKIKVGKDLCADIRRLRAIQRAVDGRATLRIDANRGYSQDDGIAFAEALDPAGVELFEQPCAEADWAANAAVAERSPVPVMLDEPICAEGDIDRAAAIPGVGLCKVKLKRFGSLRRLQAALKRIAGHGMKAVLGDGLGAEINCWMEACVARRALRNTGEFNGYRKLRPEARLLAEPLPFADGHVHVPAGWRPAMDEAKLNAHLVASHRFT